ncbi:MAG TPA: hypothetical protein ENL01_00940 [Chlorobaculum parvum]|uniref:Cupin domain-containing protein n=1 Tax=Chlorobaculum parvum TaxID=274539 RepID=A0A7C5DBJ4_9CHLB|nr:hypothetical protein [Chlorobaculum parvum]
MFGLPKLFSDYVAGVVVNIPADAKHWHGAAKDRWFAHIAFSIPAEWATVEWLEPVTDDAYNALE